MLADVKAASDTILLATIPPCLIARVFSAKLTKGSLPVGSPRIENGFGAVDELLGVLAAVSGSWDRIVRAASLFLAGQE